MGGEGGGGYVRSGVCVGGGGGRGGEYVKSGHERKVTMPQQESPSEMTVMGRLPQRQTEMVFLP